MSSLAGSFLVARPVIQDPNFRRTVILLVQHGAEGAFGLVVNRPGKVEGLPFPTFLGGPCEAPGMLMLHGHREWLDPAVDPPLPQVAPGIYLGDDDCYRRVSEAPNEGLRFRIVAGYSGWGPEQLEQELATGSWAVVAATGQALFETAAEELWETLLPPALPQPSLN